jgi:hypothetical protein
MLPVQLTQISAQLEEKNAWVLWQTASEINSSHFEIERSLDAQNFETIGSVKAATNSQTIERYAFQDAGVADKFVGSDRIYYRLKMHDQDGQFEYSKTVFVYLNPESAAVQIQPNPFHEELSINYKATAEENVTIEVRDLFGKVVFSKQYTAEIGSNIFGLNQNMVAIPGLYILSVNNGQNCRVFKILKK